MGEFQFNLRSVFVVTTLAAVILGICHYLTTIEAALLTLWILLPGLAFASFAFCVQLASIVRSILCWLFKRPPEPRP